MAKCRIIDRFAYTKGKIQFVDVVDETEKPPPEVLQAQMIGALEKRARNVAQSQHGDKCPVCGQMTLHHVEGCETCYACGYSKCGLSLN